MIFQAGIDLDIKNRKVQAIIDFDTGLIGFIEIIGHDKKEFHFYRCPNEFRIAFFEKLEHIISSEQNSNNKICRKGEVAKQLSEFIYQNQKEV